MWGLGGRGGGGRENYLPEVGGYCNVGLGVTQHLVAYDPFVTFLLGKECGAGDDPHVIPVTRQAPAHPLQPLPVVLVESLPHLRRDVREDECGVVPGPIVTILHCRKRWSHVRRVGQLGVSGGNHVAAIVAAAFVV